MKLSILLVDYNSINRTCDYVDELLAGCGKKHEISIVVVDNLANQAAVLDHRFEKTHTQPVQSTQEWGALHFYEKEGVSILYTFSGGNLGYARGNNLAAKLARVYFGSDYYLISNNDIVFDADPFFHILDKVEEAFEENKLLGVIGPKVVDVEGRSQSPRKKQSVGVRLFGQYLARLLGGAVAAKYGDWSDQTQSGICDWVMGCFFFVSQDAFWKVGGFDEGRFLYGEELMLAARMRQQELVVYYLSDVSITHDHDGVLIKSRMESKTDTKSDQEAVTDSEKQHDNPATKVDKEAQKTDYPKKELKKALKKELWEQRQSFLSDLYYFEHYEKVSKPILLLAKLWFCVYVVIMLLEKSIKRVVTSVLCKSILLPGIAVFLFSSLFSLILYIQRRFQIQFGELLYTLAMPTTGTNQDIIKVGFRFCCIRIGIILFLYLLASYLVVELGRLFTHNNQKKVRRLTWWFGGLFAVFLLGFSVYYANRALGIRDYFEAKKNPTTLYEDYYVSPDCGVISAEGKTKNLIYIWLESMENTYSSDLEGGYQVQNLIPNMTSLAMENISFSHTDKLGGFRATEGCTWTMGALFAGSSGVPFAFPVDGNSMEQFTYFAPGIVSLGDVLESQGYHNYFLCGSDIDFAGRGNYYRQHGNYEILDYSTAKEKGYIPQDYYEWWGFEDQKLYEIAKKELTRIAALEEPFNYTMLTVDTHYNDGYICALCGDEYEDVASNVVVCADRQLREFIDWVTAQDFYEDCVVVITGDHPRMDTCLVEGIKRSNRTMYNCFLNVDREPALGENNRIFTTMDLFPTTLSVMGFSIAGDRLGLGTDLFSTRETLAEEMGYKALSEELKKYSAYYEEHFD